MAQIAHRFNCRFFVRVNGVDVDGVHHPQCSAGGGRSLSTAVAPTSCLPGKR